MAGRKSEGTRRTGWGYSGADDESLSRDRTASPATGLAGLARSPLFRWVGTLPTRGALYILLGATAFGVLGTLVTKNEPGFLLGLCIIVGSVVAALSIRLQSVYLLIPLPALIFFVTCVVTGAVHDSSIDTSRSQTYLSFVQWIADVFFGMCAATILVVIISGGRWVFSRMLVSGQFVTFGSGAGGSGRGGAGGSGRGPRGTPAPGQRADRDWRPSRDSAPMDPGDPWGDRDNPGGQRASRGQVDSRDPWGDRRQPPASGQRPAPQPGDRGYPGTQPSASQPGDRAYPGSQPSASQPGDRGYPGTQPSPGQPGDRGYPGGQQPGGGERAGNRALPPGRNPRGQRDQRDDRGTQGAGDQRFYRDRRHSGDPWSLRLAPETRA